MIDLIIIIMAGIVLLFLLSCCFMVARLLDEEISMYGYEGKENREREQLPDKLSRSSTDERHCLSLFQIPMIPLILLFLLCTHSFLICSVTELMMYMEADFQFM